MIVYVESNFVLEIAFGQEESVGAECIIEHAERGEIELVIPAFALSEPFVSLEYQGRKRKDLYASLTTQLKQFSRSVHHQTDVSNLRSLLPAFATIGTREDNRLADITERLLSFVRSIPTDTASFSLSRKLREKTDLSGPDSIILAVVLHDLEERPQNERKWFISRNWHDFRDQYVVDCLHNYNCRYEEHYDSGLNEIRSALSFV